MFHRKKMSRGPNENRSSVSGTQLVEGVTTETSFRGPMEDSCRAALIIIMLCGFLSGSALVLQYSREVELERYSNTSVVMLSESLKLVTSACILLNDSQSRSKANGRHWSLQLFHLLNTGKDMLWLVVMYSLSNLCSLYAIGTVGAAVSTVVVQLKVLTTAFFGTILMGKKYSATQWMCLLVLVIACVMVSYAAVKQSGSAPGGIETLLGMICLGAQVTISGFASVYFESLLKTKQNEATIWERNFQLAAYSVLALMAITICQASADYSQLFEAEFSQQMNFQPFRDVTFLAITVAVLEGGAGLSVAATLKYLNSIVKCFANCLAIILLAIANVVFFERSFVASQAVGCVLAIAAMVLYTLHSQ